MTKRVYLKDKYDWESIQNQYNNGLSLTDIIKTGIISGGALLRGRIKGYVKFERNTKILAERYKHKRPKNISSQHRDKISKTVSEKASKGQWHCSFKKTRCYSFNSKFAGEVKLHGTWELAYAKYLDDNNINWCRPKDRFKYNFDQLKRGYGYYTPDFYLVQENIWVEIKGYETEKDKAKWSQFPHTLKVIRGTDLKNLNLIKI